MEICHFKVWDTAKAVFGGEITALNEYVGQKERLKIINLNYDLKKPEKNSLTNKVVREDKYISTISDIGNKYIIDILKVNN